MAGTKKSAAVQLDERLGALRELDLSRPPKGWVRAIRDALGMTSPQLAQRMGIAQPQVSKFERREAAGTAQLDTLARVAEALDCTLVYALVPNRPLEDRVRDRARELAIADLSAVDRTMVLEAQQAGINDDAIDAYAEELIGSSRLWDRDDGRAE